ncbi:hypothetical protein [Clostridium butyricum]|uniref:hypothetical protein n=1 Tax=Clostridium butyricum TaxID=1492 RepID=UPI0022E07C42|nr:hypothetical protein [Clostridium butyricum]
MKIINLLNIIKNTLKKEGIDVPNNEIKLDEFIKGYSDEYEGFLYKKGAIEERIKLDIGVGNIELGDAEENKIYVICGNEDNIIYMISIVSDNDVKACINVNKNF